MKHGNLRLIFFLFALALTACLAVGGALADGEPWSGSGTETDPWQIASPAELQALAERVNSGDSCRGKWFALTQDVDLSDVCGADAGLSWEPIGNRGDVTFYGVFDGGGHSVTGLYVSGGGSYRGLFGTVSGTVRDLNVVGSVLGGDSDDHVGGVVGMSYGDIGDCSFSGSVTGRSYVGGVAGAVGPGCTVSNCSSDAFVSGSGSAVGGVVGWANGVPFQEDRSNVKEVYADAECSGTVSGCSFSGTLLDRSSNYLLTKYNSDTEKLEIYYETNAYGGVVGWANGYRLTGCVNSGTVTCVGPDSIGGGDFIGGVVGDAGNGSVLTDCVNNGSVQGRMLTGGVAGWLHISRAENCSNNGAIYGVQLTGGVVGGADNGSAVEGCVNSAEGSVTCGDSAAILTGGVVGLSNCFVSGCTNAGTVAGRKYVGGVVGFSTKNVSECTNLAGSSVVCYDADGGQIGGVAGTVASESSIIECANYGTVDAASSFVGGVAGYVTGSAIKCVNHGEVSGAAMLGGVAGHVAYNVTDCVNYGAVSGAVSGVSNVGGVVGESGFSYRNDMIDVNKSSLTGCENHGEVTVTGRGYVGGVVGCAFNYVIDGCRNLERVTAEITVTEADKSAYVGGVAGYAFGCVSNCENSAAVSASSTTGTNAIATGGVAGGAVAAEDCSNSGEVTGEAITGGVMGYIGGKAERCSNSGAVTGDNQTGGVIGSIGEDGSASDCENNGPVTGVNYTGGVAGSCFDTLADSVNRAQVHGQKCAGGVVGYSKEGSVVTRCINAAGGNVTATDEAHSGAGGVAGWCSGTVDDCVNYASVTGIDSIGGIAGKAFNGGLIINSLNAAGSTVSGTGKTGGIAGMIDSGSSLTYCVNAGTVTGTEATGGVTGYVSVDSTVSHCVNDEIAVVSGGKATGGIAGYMLSADADAAYIEYCENKGPVSGTEHETGGVIGGVVLGTVRYCVNSGVVSGTESVGGIAGGSYGLITECTNLGATVGSSRNVGGIAGVSGSVVTKCENKGGVTGRERTGGIVGAAQGQVDQCLNRGAVTGNGYYKGGVAGSLTVGTLSNCSNYGNVTGANGGSDVSCMGGIAGYCGGTSATVTGQIIDCTNYADLTGQGMGVGGIVGQCEEFGVVTGCSNKGKITAGAEQTGGIVGSISSADGTVTKCKNSGKVVGGKDYIGGVAGYSRGTVSSCSNSAEITGGYATGGVVGHSYGGTVSDCKNESGANVSGSRNVGGVVGYIRQTAKYEGAVVKGSVSRCSNAANVSATGNYAGGVVGQSGGEFERHEGQTYAVMGSPISHCANTGGTVTGGGVGAGGVVGYCCDEPVSYCSNSAAVTGAKNRTGGIVGVIWDTSLSYCKNTGQVTGNNEWETGGIAGFSASDVSYCVNGAKVTGGQHSDHQSQTGGIVGCQQGRSIEHCTNNGQVTGSDMSVGGIVGICSGHVRYCQNTAKVIGGTDVGGIAGQFQDKEMKQCRNTGEVHGISHVGGIAGFASNGGSFSQCACPNTSTYIHTNSSDNCVEVGGLIGKFEGGTISNSYSRAVVWGYDYAGGIIGNAGTKSKVTMECCYCFAPSGNSHVSGESGVDCKKDSERLCGALVGGKVNLELKHCLWYTGCTNWALGDYAGSWRHLGISDYKYFLYESDFKNTGYYYSGYDFDSTWEIRGGTAMLKFELDSTTIISEPTAPTKPGGVPADPGASTGSDRPGTTGDGPAARTIGIYSVDDLKALAASVNGGDDCANAEVVLCADLDLSGESWTPIGTFTASADTAAENRPFNGTFDGRGYAITGLNVEKTSAGAAGLFGFIGAGGTVRELSVSGSVTLTVSDGMALAGGIAGVNAGVIERCEFNGSVSGSAGSFAGGAEEYAENSAGGIAGLNRGRVSCCVHAGTVSGGSRSGGIVGGSGGVVEYCLHAGGSVSSENAPGGVVGRAFGGSVSSCRASDDSAAEAVGDAGGAAVSDASVAAAEALSLQTAYGGWDFDTVWGMGEAHPLLRCLSECVTLLPNEGEGEEKTVRFSRGSTLRVKNCFTRSGYVFAGWNTEELGRGVGLADFAEIDRSMTLYARWIKGAPYAGAYTPLAVTEGFEGVSEDRNYEKLLDGDEGTKWCVADAAGEFAVEFSTADYIVPCAYAMTAADDAESHAGCAPRSWTLEAKAHAEDDWILLTEEADDDTLPPVNGATIFKPLFNTGEYCCFRLTVRSVGSAGALRLSEFRILTNAPVRQARIVLDPKGGSGDVQSVNGAVGGSVTLPECPYQRTGYDFAGWCVGSDGSGKVYAAGEDCPVAGDTTLYALWEEKTFTVRFLADDGSSAFSVITADAGQMPLYDGPAPTKASTAMTGYKFTGWTPAVKAVAGDTDYYATFGEYERTYSVTWKNGDTTVEFDPAMSYNSLPVYNSAVPTKADDAAHSYTFSGWSDGKSFYPKDAPLPPVTEDTVFTAQFSAAPRKYGITWEDWDGTVLRVDPVAYGDTPSYGESPEREADAQYSYTFSGWSPAVAPVTGEKTYTAQYDPTLRSYTVIWQNYDGTVLQTDENVLYGTTPGCELIPERPATVSTEYTFSHWYPAIQNVTGDVTYTAQFGDAARCYTVQWLNGDSLLEQDTVPYGTMPAYYGDEPVKRDEGYYTYSFAGWTPEVVKVESDAVYSAVFDAATVSFDLRFRSNGGLGAMGSSTVLRGLNGVLPESGFTPPSKKVFDAWEIDGVRYAPGDVYTVSKDTAVIALWKDLHTVTWANYDGTVLRTDEVPEGDVPVYTGALPVRPDDAEHIHTFAGWSPAPVPAAGAATYTAQYDASPQLYTVTWKNSDGTVLEIDAEAPYGSMPKYDGNTPQQQTTSDIVYGFSGWSPEVVPVTGDAVYTAQFEIEEVLSRNEIFLQDFPSELKAPAGGRILIRPGAANRGQTVKLTAEPEEGWKLAELKVRLKNGAEGLIELNDRGGGVYTFTMPEKKIDIEALFEPVDLCAMFPDLDPDGWYLEHVRWAVSHGVMRGTDRGFEPNVPTTRAMVAQILFNLSGEEPGETTDAFDDVRPGDWYAAAVSWAVKNGIAQGKGASFDPNGPITREQTVVMLWNFEKYMGRDVGAAGGLEQFKDADRVSGWAADAMRWAVGAGIVNGMGDGTLDPQGSTTRAQIAALIRRLVTGG
jgi:uncharacterized repeat protein (TIGR02543 family)